MKSLQFVKQLLKIFRKNGENVSVRPPLLMAGGIVIFCSLCFLIYQTTISPPRQFPRDTVVAVEDGTTLAETAHLLEEKKVIRSPLFLRVLVETLGKEHLVVAGDYFFEDSVNVFVVAHMLAKGDFGLSPFKITIPEGVTLVEMASIFGERLSMFDTERFLTLTVGKEGFLFPDTYYFLPNADAEKVVAVLERTFKEKIEPFEKDIEDLDRSLEDVVIMASLIEREAKTPESRRIISGILWRRIDIGMPLQVDVTFLYINGKTTFDLSLEDLDIDSPYNTYQYAGLPPGPIGSPGLDSLEAAVYPTETDYLYFLADQNGEIHYSSTFEEHRKKKETYLN